MAALETFPSLMPRDDRRGQEQVPSVFRCWRRRQRSVSRVGPATLPAATYGQQKISSLWPDNTCSLASNAGRSLASSARGSVFLYSSASSRARAYRGSVVMCHNVRVHVCLWCSFVIAPHHHAHAVWHAIYTTHGDDCYKEELLVSLLDMPVRPSKFSEIFCYYHQTSRCISLLILALVPSFLGPGILLLIIHFFFGCLVHHVHSDISHFDISNFPLCSGSSYILKRWFAFPFTKLFFLCHFYITMKKQNSWPLWSQS